MLRQRAAAWVNAVNDGSAASLWLAFVRPARHAPLVEDEHLMEDELLVDYDDLPPPLLSNIPDDEQVLRKQAFLGSYGEWGQAWRAAQQSPSLDPKKHDSKRALIGLNPQRAHKPLTGAHVANKPGVAAIQFTPAQVDKAARNLRDIKAAGTLPEDNRLIKCLVKHGGCSAVTTWINATCRDEGHPIARDLLAGAVRAALNAKCDPVTGEVKGHRPLGMVEKWRCLIWACVNAKLRCALDRNFTSPAPEDVEAHERRVADAEAAVTAAALERDAAAGSGMRRSRATEAAHAAAEATLAAAKRPLKFVSNWCFSSKGTEKLAFLTRGWVEREPRKGLLSDDISAMYQWVSRWPGFTFLHPGSPASYPSFASFTSPPQSSGLAVPQKQKP